MTFEQIDIIVESLCDIEQEYLLLKLIGTIDTDSNGSGTQWGCPRTELEIIKAIRGYEQYSSVVMEAIMEMSKRLRDEHHLPLEWIDKDDNNHLLFDVKE
jgi:cystathionine beta-lyase family protein involved in aluminum resistance